MKYCGHTTLPSKSHLYFHYGPFLTTLSSFRIVSHFSGKVVNNEAGNWFWQTFRTPYSIKRIKDSSFNIYFPFLYAHYSRTEIAVILSIKCFTGISSSQFSLHSLHPPTHLPTYLLGVWVEDLPAVGMCVYKIPQKSPKWL